MVPLYGQITSATWAMSGKDDAQVTWWQRQWFAFQMHYFKINATENLSATHMVKLAKLADSDPQIFSVTRDKYRAWLRDSESLYSPRTLYNPIGTILVSIAVPGMRSTFCVRTTLPHSSDSSTSPTNKTTGNRIERNSCVFSNTTQSGRDIQ